MREGEKKLMKASMRSARNEASFMWSLLGCLFFLMLYLGVRPLIPVIWPGSVPVCLVLGFAIAGVVSFFYYLTTAPKIKRYQLEYNEIMKRKKAEMREAHLENLQQKQQEKIAGKENENANYQKPESLA